MSDPNPLMQVEIKKINKKTKGSRCDLKKLKEPTTAVAFKTDLAGKIHSPNEENVIDYNIIKLNNTVNIHVKKPETLLRVADDGTGNTSQKQQWRYNMSIHK